jgi:uncharacterized protein (TIRG00374 family)
MIQQRPELQMGSAPKQTNRKWIVLSMIAGFAVLAFYLYSFAGIGAVAKEFMDINLYYYVLGFVAVVMGVLCLSLSWNNLLSGLQLRISRWRTFLFEWVGLFIDEVIPGGISGDFFKAYLISRDTEYDTGKVVSTVVVQKLFGVVIVMVNLIAGLTLLTLNYGLQIGFLILSVVSISLLVALFVAFVYFSVNPKATERAVGGIARFISLVRRKTWDKKHFQESAKKTLGPFHEGIESLRGNPKVLVKAAIFSALATVCDVTLVVLVFRALSFPLPLDKALIVYALTISLQTSGVAVIGFTEVLMSSLYIALGVSKELSIAATLLIRFASLWFKLAIAFVGFQSVVLNRCVDGVCKRASLWSRSKSCPEPSSQRTPDN